MFAISIENLKKLKYNIIFKKNIIFFLYTVSPVMNIKKYLMKNNQLKY